MSWSGHPSQEVLTGILCSEEEILARTLYSYKILLIVQGKPCYLHVVKWCLSLCEHELNAPSLTDLLSH